MSNWLPAGRTGDVMAGMRIEWNNANIEHLLTSGEVAAECVRRAEQAADTARKLTPSRDKDAIVSGPTDKGGYVGSTSSFYHFWEWGTRYSAARAPLRSGVEAAGLRFRED